MMFINEAVSVFMGDSLVISPGHVILPTKPPVVNEQKSVQFQILKKASMMLIPLLPILIVTMFVSKKKPCYKLEKRTVCI